MKSIVLLIVAVLLVTTSSFGKKIKGVIIRNGESTEVTFNVKIPFLGGEPSFERMQQRIKYFDESGAKHVLEPEDASEIQFEFDGQKIRMLSVTDNLGLGNGFSSRAKIFLKLEIDGPLKLFRHYYRQTSGGMMTAGGGYTPGTTYTVENYIFLKENGVLKRPKAIGWKKDMLEYFRDCPQLASLIESKDLRRKEIEAIVMFYNKNCAGK